MTSAAARAALTAALDNNTTLAARAIAELRVDGWHIVPIGPGRRAKPLDVAFRANTAPVPGGHLEWTGTRNADGRPRYTTTGHRVLTAAQLAWRISRERPAEGQVRPDCGHRGCVAPEHLADRRDRELARAVLAAPTATSGRVAGPAHDTTGDA